MQANNSVTFDSIVKYLSFLGQYHDDSTPKYRKVVNMFIMCFFIYFFPSMEIYHFVISACSGANLLSLVEIANGMIEVCSLSYKAIFFMIFKNNVFKLKSQIEEFSQKQKSDRNLKKWELNIYKYFIVSLIVSTVPAAILLFKITTIYNDDKRSLGYDIWVPLSIQDNDLNFILMCLFGAIISIYYLTFAMVIDFMYLSLVGAFKGSCNDFIADLNEFECKDRESFLKIFEMIIEMRRINGEINWLVSRNFVTQFLKSVNLCASVYCLVRVSIGTFCNNDLELKLTNLTIFRFHLKTT